MSPWSDTVKVWHRKLEIRCCTFFVQRIIHPKLTGIQMVTDCLLVREVHWVQSTYWNAAKANGPFILHRTPLHSSPLPSSWVQLSMQQVSESDLIPVEWTQCDTVCQYTRLYGQSNDSVVYWTSVHLMPDLVGVQKSSANWSSCTCSVRYLAAFRHVDKWFKCSCAKGNTQREFRHC
jgi:hypothetical protein